MKKYYFLIQDDVIFYLPKLIEKFDGNKLILSLIQENRQLEKLYEIEEYVIYDNSDVLSNIISLEDAIIGIDDSTDILPSSYKKKKDSVSKELFENEIYKDYDYVFFLLDQNLNYELNNEIIAVCPKPENGYKNIVCSKFDAKIVRDNKIYGFLNDNEKDLNHLYENLENNKLLDYNKFTFFQKLKELLK